MNAPFINPLDPNSFVLQHGGTSTRIFYNKLMRLQFENNHVVLYMADKEPFYVNANFSSFRDFFSSRKGFVECYRNQIVNLHSVSEVSKDESRIIMTDGSVCPVSRRKLKCVMKQWHNLESII